MRQVSFLFTLVGAGVVTAVFLWWRAAGDRVPEPTLAAMQGATTRAQPRSIGRPKTSECTPLAEGGFSCGVCRGDSDCPPEQGCVIDLQSGRTECRGSDCNTTDDCDAGTSCQVVGRTSRGEPLRACVPPGTRPSGAACDPENGSDPSVSCGPGLMCVDGGCAPACVPNDISEMSMCPGDLPCVKTPTGWGCTPTCKGKPCGEGKACSFLSVEGPISLCTHAVGASCLGSKGGCADDEDCIVETNVQKERTTFSCVKRCAVDDDCPGGSVCAAASATGSAHCRRRCAPGGGQHCAAGENCRKAAGEGNVWYCSAGLNAH